MIVKDNLLALRGFGAEPWEYQPTEPGYYVKSGAESAESYTQPVIEPAPTNYVEKSSGNAYVDSPSAQPAPTNYVEKSSGNAYVDSPSAQPAQTESTFNWTGLANTAVGLVGGIASIFQPKQQQVVIQQQRKPLIPSWVLPASIIGGAGLLAVAVLSKPKRGSLSGYSRRRRRSRRSRR